MDHDDFGRWRGRDHAHVVHMYMSVRVVMVKTHTNVRVMMVVMSNTMSHVSSMSGIVCLMVLCISTSLYTRFEIDKKNSLLKPLPERREEKERDKER
jgi:hypothetical protein